MPVSISTRLQITLLNFLKKLYVQLYIQFNSDSARMKSCSKKIFRCTVLQNAKIVKHSEISDCPEFYGPLAQDQICQRSGGVLLDSLHVGKISKCCFVQNTQCNEFQFSWKIGLTISKKQWIPFFKAVKKLAGHVVCILMMLIRVHPCFIH